MRPEDIELDIRKSLKNRLSSEQMAEVEALSQNPFKETPQSLVAEIWNAYTEYLRNSIRNGLLDYQDSAYTDPGYRIVQIPAHLIAPLADSVAKARHVPLRHEDYAPGYSHHIDLRPYEARLNQDHRWLTFGYHQMKAIEPVLKWLEEPFEYFSGLPWRVSNLRAWRTQPGAVETGPNTWHVDGYPLCSFKLMIYLSEVGENLGTTEMRLADGQIRNVTGPAGSCLIFRNSEIFHRGVAPQVGERTILEITTVPAWKTDTTPVTGGTNARIPNVPWYYR